ncbi:hypothetical protein [Streptomyces colonosanans]|uniref:Uncharacterized protein n=1 Tax=Streptomyces colonosanans TaxID=1428652 RepID=A0A1S2PN55_9ACTN|nr:hypothetical protein [Streptomyces colonosanans]OIJ95238.1 hypothetical protein BIV24_09490 [Streptomyces colonosanans]
MIEYELQRIHSAELIREADDYRLARESLRQRRAARETDGEIEAEDRSHSGRRRRLRVARAA